MTGGDESLDSSRYARLVRDGAFNYGAQLISSLVGFALVPLLLHHLGAQSYGVLVIALAAAALAKYGDLGLGSVLTWEVAARSRLDAQRFLRTAATMFLAFGVLGAGLLAVLGVLAHALSLGSSTAKAPLVFLFVGVMFFGDQVTLYHTAVLGGLQRFDVLNALGVAAVGVRAVGTVVLIEAAGAGIQSIALWYAVSSWLEAAANLIVMRRLSGQHALRPGYPDRASVRARFGFGAGSTGLAVSVAAIWNTGPLIVAAAHGAAASALFQVSQRFPVASLTLPERMSVALFPAAGETADRPEAESPYALIVGGIRLISVILLPVVVALLATAGPLLHAWLGSTPAHGAFVLRVTTIAVLVYGLASSPVQVLWGRGRVSALAWRLMTAATLAVALSTILAVSFGWWWAVVGLLSGALVAGVSVLNLAAGSFLGIARNLLGPAHRGLVLPTAASVLVAAALDALGVARGWPGLIVTYIAIAVAYIAALLGHGRAIPERDVVDAVRRSSRGVTSRAASRVRRYVHQFPPLHRAAILRNELRELLREGRRSDPAACLVAYERDPDPWGYQTTWGAAHLALIEQLLTDARLDKCHTRAADVGCGEGWITRLIAGRCHEVLATDISEVALERAQARCSDFPHVRFRRWDVMCDAPLGRFDFVIAAGVIECFRRRPALRHIRRRLVDMLDVDGLLLVTTTKQPPPLERGIWARLLVRGSNSIDRFLRRTDELDLMKREESDSHVLTLYRLSPRSGASR